MVEADHRFIKWRTQGMLGFKSFESPVCTPSRFSLLTGQYPQRSKHDLSFALMPADKNYLDTAEHTIAWYLRQKTIVPV